MLSAGRVVALVVAAACALLVPGQGAHAQSDPVWRVEPVVVVTTKGRYSFSAEIADEPELRSRGLMFRNSLDDDKAMLFDFKVAAPVSMWMKNTFIPLDMLFIAADGRVITVARWTTPQSTQVISSGGDALGVLELNAGTADRIRIRPGDTVIHRIFGNQ